MIKFIKENYCDIEAYPLPRIVGVSPSKIRLIINKDLDKLLKKQKKIMVKNLLFFYWILIIETLCISAGKDNLKPPIYRRGFIIIKVFLKNAFELQLRIQVATI